MTHQNSSNTSFDKEDLQTAIEVLKKGGLILYPTDTVWGIGCDATNPGAVERIYKLKERADTKSMLVLVHNEASLERTVKNIPDIAWELMDAAVNPITIIYDNPVGVASSLLANDGSLGVRITKEQFSNELCKRLNKPIVSTSANISGEKSPQNFSQINKEIKEGVDYIVKYRQNENSTSFPSNVIKLSEGGVVKVIR